jgi:hypothetical protein
MDRRSGWDGPTVNQRMEDLVMAKEVKKDFPEMKSDMPPGPDGKAAPKTNLPAVEGEEAHRGDHERSDAYCGRSNGSVRGQ